MSTFVYIIGNAEKRFFKLGSTNDLLGRLSTLQESSPFELSLLSKVQLKDSNSASVVEALAYRSLKQFEGVGGWIVEVPGDILLQFISGEYLLAMASGAGVQIVTSRSVSNVNRTNGSHRLSRKASSQGLSFDDILSRVEQAYEDEIAADTLF